MNYEKYQGLHVLRLKGSLTERARQHAFLLRGPIREEIFPAFAKKNEWIIRRAPGPTQAKFVQDKVVHFYKKVLLPLIARNLKIPEKQMLQAMADELDLTEELCQSVAFQPDVLMLLARLGVMKHILPEYLPGGLPGCTSAILLKEWSRNEKLLACRNLDYIVLGAWEKHTTLAFNEPEDSREVPYVALTTAGVHSGGLTSMNREGLTLFTHAHYGKKVSLKGRPIVMIGDELIQKCRTIGEAVDVARRNKTSACWSFLVSSAKENAGVVIEMTPQKVKVREPSQGYLGHTNYFHDSELQKQEALFCGSYWEDLKGRYSRLKELISSQKGKLTPEFLAQTLGDQTDYFSRTERVIGNTVGVVTTVQSAVFQPDDQLVWVSSRSESPTGLGRYVEINADTFWASTSEKRKDSFLTGYIPKHPNLSQAIQNYRKAYLAFHMENDREDYQSRALQGVIEAIEAYPLDGHLWVQAGLLSFQLQKWSKAISFFKSAQELSLSPHVFSVTELFMARCYDLLGKRDEALSLYHKNLTAQEPKLQKAFRKGVSSPYRLKHLSRIFLDLQFPDTFQY